MSRTVLIEKRRKWEAADLVLQHISKTYTSSQGRPVKAVDDISLTIRKGEFVTLLGPSGCGKSTTLRLIAGFEEPDTGEICVGGKSMNSVPAYKRNMPMVFQSYALFPHLSVYDNIAYGLKVRNMPRDVIKDEVEIMLQLVNLAGLENRLPGELAGGQQQRVALARALVLKPGIILFDEPLSNLDAKLRIQMRMEIKRMQQLLGITMLYVTHDQAEALSLSDKIMVMNKGRIEQAGTPETIYNKPESLFVADFIGNANFIEGVVDEIGSQSVKIIVQDQMLDIPGENIRAKIEEEEEVYLSIKPEAVYPVAAGTGFKGTLACCLFTGSTVQLEIEFGNSMLTCIQPNTGNIHYTCGLEICFNFKSEFFQVFKCR